MNALNTDHHDTELLRKRRIFHVQVSLAQPELSFRRRCKQDVDPSAENYLSRLMVDVLLYKEARGQHEEDADADVRRGVLRSVGCNGVCVVGIIAS